jgi:hypothetical protein
MSDKTAAQSEMLNRQSAEETLRRIVTALGHLPSVAVSSVAAEDLVDTWVRAMAIIARHVGAPDSRNPMGVAQAVEDRIAGRPIAAKPSPAPAPVVATAMAAAQAPVAAPAVVPKLVPIVPTAAAAQATSDAHAADGHGLRAFVRDGHVYVELGGVRMRVTRLTLSP